MQNDIPFNEIENEEGFNDETQELYEHHRFVVDKGQTPLRIDKYLMNLLSNATRNKIQKAAKDGKILINGKVVKSNQKVQPHDVVTIVLSYPPKEVEIFGQDIPLDIFYEDDDLLIVNKQPNMVVHPSYGNYSGTLLNALKFHFEQNNLDINPMMVHRIDKDTSGLLLIAKNEKTQTHLGKQFFDHTIDRKYQALVWGDFDEDEGTIEGAIGRNPKNRKIMTVFPDNDYGKPAITHYKVLERFSYVTLVECVLETGRTHQIRAHMRYAKHPLFNDSTYGGDQILKGTTFSKYKQFIHNCFSLLPRQALHAKSLGFVHPGTGERVHFESELPNDMQSVIEKWRVYAQHKLNGEELLFLQ